MNINDIVAGYPVMKMHGCGNDFVVLTDFNEKIVPEQAKAICARHFGIGADGLITIVKSRIDGVPWRMKFFNPDGSTAEMCGNGIRCFIKYLFDHGLITKKEFPTSHGSRKPLPVDTDAGIISPEIVENTDREAQVRVNMGIPELYNKNQINGSLGSKARRGSLGSKARRGSLGSKARGGSLGSKARGGSLGSKARGGSLGKGGYLGKQGVIRGNVSGQNFTFVSMGNPHAVIFSEQPEKDVHKFGPVIENNTALFPQKINVEFIKVVSPDKIVMYVWERGAGITLACGTGACAGFVAAVLNGYCRTSAIVQLPGGDLSISWEGIGKPVLMTGSAVNVFEISLVSLDRYLNV